MVPAYERDPYLTHLDTQVVERGVEGDRPYVVLADTVLYPEGGGQPADRGWIAGVAVEDVRRVEGRIRHRLAKPVAGDAVAVALDWDRRFDHMQQHTAQHLLSAVAAERFGLATTAFHLGAAVSDIELDAAGMPPDRLEALEEAVAAEIRAARRVTGRRVSAEEFARLAVRTRGLPEGHTGDIRLVEIAGLDLNTCGGTHVRSTAEIEALKLLGTEPMRGGTRLRFAAGRRLRRLLAAHEARSARLRQLLGGADDELPALVAAKLEQAKEAGRKLRALEEELAAQTGAALAASGRAVAAGHWPERDAAFLQRVAKAYVGRAPRGLALLTAGEGEAGAFLLCAGPDAAVDLAALGREVAATLGGRGGGAGRMFQGKATALSQREAALARVRAAAGRAG
ncbi:MAG: alanyl-tRNA editing protein [Candidatus Methylomirabilales bacterium]